MYQLENGPLQSSPEFSNLASGDYTINVVDVYGGCGILPLTVTVINYPKFFTPNGDGFNDTWNISDLRDQDDAEILIFDRYGKFMTNISPNGPGWDGTYNDEEAFSTDYWFVVKYRNQNDEPKEFRAHFSLKR